MTYLILNVGFTLAALLASLWVLTKSQRRVALIALAPLLLATALFDNLIVGFGIVAYDSSKICGIFVGVVPIEDFCYSLAAVWLVPSIWQFASNRRSRP
jgi:lycopene cyclase domain-containing protein